MNEAAGKIDTHRAPSKIVSSYRSMSVPKMFLPNHASPWFAVNMVGPIKTLTDLRRIEAAVRVTCKACGFVRMIDREHLIQQCQFHRSASIGRP